MARAVQQVFKQMRGLGQRQKAEGGGAALDRMRGAKNRMQMLAVRRLQVQAKKQLLHFSQQLIGFFKKGLIKLGDVHHGLSNI